MTRSLSNLEHVLTYRIRRFLQHRLSPDQIRYLSFTLSLVTCLFDANVTVFSLFIRSFINKLNYSQLTVNIISGSMLVGLYLTLPLLGYLSDLHGPVLLSMIGFLLVPGYYFANVIFQNQMNFVLMAISFFFIGAGSSSSYFCSLLTCARVFPERKGLSISLPVSFYGISSFLFAWLFTFDFFNVVTETEKSIDINKVFTFLCVLYLFVFIVNWVSSVVVSIEKEIVFSKLYELENESERPVSYGSIETEDVVLNAGVINELSHEEKFQSFLKDPSMKLVLLSLLFIAGPLELFIANLSTINGGSEIEISQQISIFSILSTITRLIMGFMSDRFNSCRSNVILLNFATAFTVAGFLLIAIGTKIEVPFYLISSVVGMGHGTVFSMYPTLTATIWGVEILGSTWGLFLSAPAIGSIIFGMFYSVEFDKLGINLIFFVMSAFVFIGGGCINYSWRVHWIHKIK